jgi:hypothetical protein
VKEVTRRRGKDFPISGTASAGDGCSASEEKHPSPTESKSSWREAPSGGRIRAAERIGQRSGARSAPSNTVPHTLPSAAQTVGERTIVPIVRYRTVGQKTLENKASQRRWVTAQRPGDRLRLPKCPKRKRLFRWVRYGPHWASARMQSINQTECWNREPACSRLVTFKQLKPSRGAVSLRQLAYRITWREPA